MKVAIMDSGVSDRCVNTCENVYSVMHDSGVDEFGHGCMVYETINRMAGSNVKIDSIKVLDEKGRGDTRSILDGLFICIEQQYDIICMSLSFTKTIDRIEEKKLKTLFVEMKRKGQVVFCSTKNKAYDWTSVPASYEEVYGVYGGITGDEEKYYYDKRRKVQIFASGEPIVVRDLNGERTIFKGNSKATALISGFIAGTVNSKFEIENALCENAYARTWSRKDFKASQEGKMHSLNKVFIEKGSLIADIVNDAYLQKDYLGESGARDRDKKALRIISYVEKQLGISFKDESILFEDMVNNEKLIYAMENKWERKEKI